MTGETTNTTNSANGFGFGLGGGVNVMIRGNVALTPEVQYRSKNSKSDGSSTTSTDTVLYAGITVFI